MLDLIQVVQQDLSGISVSSCSYNNQKSLHDTTEVGLLTLRYAATLRPKLLVLDDWLHR